MASAIKGAFAVVLFVDLLNKGKEKEDEEDEEDGKTLVREESRERLRIRPGDDDQVKWTSWYYTYTLLDGLIPHLTLLEDSFVPSLSCLDRIEGSPIGDVQIPVIRSLAYIWSIHVVGAACSSPLIVGMHAVLH
jgi:hypothetical protein